MTQTEYPRNYGDWDAGSYFEMLTNTNRLAKKEGFRFATVSGLEGFHEALAERQTARALVCVSDVSDGYTDLDSGPVTRRVKTVFMAMRHTKDPGAAPEARRECFRIMREVHRQMLSAVMRERVKLAQERIALEPRVSFNEIEKYFATGCACAYFQLSVDIRVDLGYNSEDWET